MTKVGLQVMSAVLLPLVCGSCATQSGILYGSKIELEAGSDRDNGSKARVDEAGLFFSGCYGRIELGQEEGAEKRHVRRRIGTPLFLELDTDCSTSSDGRRAS
jgi:hypothetical protein